MSLCIGWWLTQKFTNHRNSENKDLWSAHPQMRLLHPQPLVLRLKKWKRRQIVRARGWGELGWNNVFWTLQDYRARELAEAVGGFYKVKPINIRVWDGMGSWVPIANWEAMESWWLLGEGKSVWSKNIVPGRLTTLQCVVTHPHIHE